MSRSSQLLGALSVILYPGLAIAVAIEPSSVDGAMPLILKGFLCAFLTAMALAGLWILRSGVVVRDGVLVSRDLVRSVAIDLSTVECLEWRPRAQVRVVSAARSIMVPLDQLDTAGAHDVIFTLRASVDRTRQEGWVSFAERLSRRQRADEVRADHATLLASLRRFFLTGRIGNGLLAAALTCLALSDPDPLHVRLFLCAALIGTAIEIGSAVLPLVRRSALRRARSRRHLWRTLVAHGLAEPTSAEGTVDSHASPGDSHGA